MMALLLQLKVLSGYSCRRCTDRSGAAALLHAQPAFYRLVLHPDEQPEFHLHLLYQQEATVLQSRVQARWDVSIVQPDLNQFTQLGKSF